MSNQTEPSTQWGTPPATPTPPKPKRQFTVTKIAIGVAAGIALFLVGSAVLVAVLLSGGSTGDKQAAPATTQAAFTPPASAPADPVDTTPDVTEPPSTPARDLAVGGTGSFTSDEGAADITITKVTVASRDPSEFGERAKHGWFVVVHVKAAGTSGSYDVNSFDFYAKSSNGFHTEDATYLDSWGTVLEGGTLQDGEHISGTIVYDVPTRHGKLVYSPNYDNEPLATWSY